MGDIKEDLAEIKTMMQQSNQKKPKKFKIPFFKRVNPKQAGQGYVTLFRINESKFIKPSKEKITDQTMMVDGIPRLAFAKHIFYIKKNPVVFLPTWSIEPLTKDDFETPLDLKKHQEESLENGTNTKGFEILLAAMKGSALNVKKQMGSLIKWIAGLGFGAIIVYALLTSGG